MKGHIRQRRPGVFGIVVELGRGPDGKRKQAYHTFHGGKRAAEAELNRLLHELNTGQYSVPSKLTVGQYLERWLQDYAKRSVDTKTYEWYASIIKVHLTERLGHILLADLRPLHLETYYAYALEQGRRDGTGGLAQRTVLHHHRILSEALRQAVKWQIITRNPADAVEPPRVVRKERPVLDEDEAVLLLDAAEGTTLYLPILTAITTGMRRGEILGLRWQDVDLDLALIKVSRSLQRTQSKGTVSKEPKNKKSRWVTIPRETLLPELVRHKGEQSAARLRIGEAYQDHGLVFTRFDGRPWIPNELTKAFIELRNRLPIPPVTFHDLRHTHSGLLLKEGVDLKVISERLGHSSIGITMDLYGHVLPGLQQAAAEKSDRALQRGMGRRKGALRIVEGGTGREEGTAGGLG